MTESLRNLPRYIRNTDAFGWQGADHPDGPWRSIPAPQSGLPWRTAGPAVQSREPASVACEPSDGDLLQLMPEQFRADLGTVSRMAAHGAGPDIKPGLFRVSLNTGALEYARAVLARWGRPAPAPAEGEVAEFITQLKSYAEYGTPIRLIPFVIDRAAALLERLSAAALAVVPVPVSERPWEREGWCDDEGRCWCMSSLDGPPPRWWLVRPEPLSDGWVLPAHALPLPQGEVEK